jgi:hypothetical protein
VRDRNPEDIQSLLGRFFSAEEVEAAAEDIRVGEQILQAAPPPAPDRELLDFIKAEIAARLARRRRLALVYRGVAAAAAVAIVTVIALLGRSPVTLDVPNVAYASIIPAAVWESDDVAAEDLELLYFNSEIQRIETQMRALEAGDDSVVPAGSVEEIEMELMQIETEFWKG